MTEQINQWPDSLFYYSASSTANVREQLIKLQQSSKRIRSLSDAATVNHNGDAFQDILTGLSFGNATQRHKWRALYDTTNDRYLIQRNSGTDASKTWVEKFRIDSSGNITVSGTTSNTGQITASGGIVMGGNLDMNQFYIRNLDKVNGRTRTDTLTVHGASTLQGTVTTSGALSVGTALTVGTTATVTSSILAGSNSANITAYTYAQNSADQAIAGANTDITSITALSLPNTSSVNTRSFLVEFNITVSDTSGGTNSIGARLYNGPNGTLADTLVYQTAITVNGNKFGSIGGLFKLTPGASNRTKIGLSVFSDASCTIFGSSPIFATIFVRELA